MGLVAIISSSASSVSSSAAGVNATVTSLLSPVGVGAGGVFVSAVLIYLLAYLNLYDASDTDIERVRWMIIASIIPLGMVFGAIILFEILRFL